MIWEYGYQVLNPDYGDNCIIGFSYADWTGFPINRSSTKDIVFLLEGILFHERVRNILLPLDQVRSQDTGL